MNKAGEIYLGHSYGEKTAALQRLTGQRNEPSAIRAVIDQILFAAQQAGLDELPVQSIGVVSLPVKKKRRKVTNGA